LNAEPLTVRRDGRHLPSVDVRTNSTAPTPLPEVVLQLRFDDELVELFQLSATATCPTNCLSWLRSSHDRRTMIVGESYRDKHRLDPDRPKPSTTGSRRARR
jgi:hypothetical protein